MIDPEAPLSWLDLSQTRRTVAISFFVALFFVLLTFFPYVNKVYENYPALRNFLNALAAALALGLALLELRHSGEANEHRTEQNRLNQKANTFRDEANRLSNEKNKLQADALELQVRIHQLQASIENKLTKIRLYARAHLPAGGLHLSVSNLSEFDLWINQIEVIVTEAQNAKPENRTIGGATRIPHGCTESDYQLYGTLLSINGNRTNHIDMKFKVKVVATGVTEDPVTVTSPEYHLRIGPGDTRELKVLNY